jgi:hypothetical protein
MKRARPTRRAFVLLRPLELDIIPTFLYILAHHHPVNIC